MKDQPSTIKSRPLSIDRLRLWLLIAVIGVIASMASAASVFAQIVGTAQLHVERRGHTATLLQDGKVLIVGGDNQSGMISQAEIFDPAAQTSSLVASPSIGRSDHTATGLADGRVLIIGGRDQNGALASTEIYDPSTASFAAGPSLTTALSGHTATVLSDDRILVAGGAATGSADLYNPATQSFSLVSGNMNAARKFHSAILMSSGQVLIVGGIDAQNTMLDTAEVFDPASQSFYIPPTDMQTARAFATLKLLPDGKVQIIGGDAELSMEVFDPADGIFIAKALLPPNANLLGATLSTQSRAALFSPLVVQDPLLQSVMTPEQLALLDRADQSITELPSRNQALVTGGIDSAGQTLNSVKLVSSSSASVTTDKTDYAPGQIVTITGTNFQPNEQVDIYFHEFPQEYPDIFLSAVANQQGNFVTAEFAPQEIDLGRIFTLTAIGQTSGFTAQTAFKDNHTVTVSCSPGSVSTGSSTTCTGTIGGGTMGQPSSGRTITFTSNGAGGFSSTTCVTSGTNQTASCSVSYTPSSVGTGTHRITGSSGTGGHANSNFFDVTVTTASSATTTTVDTATATYGNTSVTLSATVTSASAVNVGTVTFTVKQGATTIGSPTTSGTVTGGAASVSYALPAGTNAGSYTIEAVYSGGTGFNGSSGFGTLTINKANQTISFSTPPPTSAVYNTSFTVVATASSGLPVSYSAAGVCSHVAGVYTMTSGTGICTVQVDQAGDDNYNPAPQLMQNVTAQKANQTISFSTPPPTSAVYNTNFTVVATASSGLPVSYSATGVCSNVAGVYTMTSGTGTCTVQVDQAGNANYNPAPQLTQNVTAQKATATINITGFTGMYDGLPHGATGSAIGVLSEDLSASLNLGDTFTIVPGGTAYWTFTGGTNYNDANGSVEIVITTAFAYSGFYPPIGGSVEYGNGGSYANPLKTFKLNSTIPVKFSATWLNGGAALITGTHKLEAIKYSNSTDSDPPIDATPTDAATTGNHFRLTGTEWHFNLSTNGLTGGTWLLRVTLEDGSQHTVWITIKK